ncbi:MAG: M14 family metallopeptidase [Planctomycetota bacterium]
MSRFGLFALVACVLLGIASHLAADDGEHRFPVTDHDTREGLVETPSDYFGVPLGERFTPHHDVLRYGRYLAEKSDRVEFQSYGTTAEGRELYYLIISSEANLRRLDEIRDLQMRLADPRTVEGAGELDAILEQLPAVVWMSYNVHGNEASATEAGLRTMYQLIDGSDVMTRTIRENSVVILDPLLNPDGRERYLQWYHSVAVPGGDPNPRSREHSEPWPGGRSNHYYFDLNRDWAWLSQIETQARAPHYLSWQPLVHGDFHEMSPESTYFFFPAEEPVNANYTDHTIGWGQRFGRANADAFDRFGWMYYTEESFDLFYPGYGDSWPSLHGAIGMTYEQGGGPRGGLRYKRRDGSILTLTERLHHHVVASMATLECAARERDALQRSFHEFRAGAAADVAEYISPPQEGERLDNLVRLLVRQGVEVHTTAEPCVAESLTDHFGEGHDLVRLPAGTRIVSLDQPAGRLARALIEPEAKVTVNRFYDISAWSLPFSMGVQAFSAPDPIEVERSLLEALPSRSGSVQTKARYSYMIPWNGVPAARALHALQSEGLRVRLVPEEIEIHGERFDGCLQIPVIGQESVHEIVARVSVESGVHARAVHSGLSEKGIDLGSDKVIDLARPKIAIASGEGVRSSSFGALWFLFERELEIPFTAFNLDDFDALDLHNYNVLILPSGFGYRKILSGDSGDDLRAWVRGGGVLIAIGGAAFACSAEDSKFTSISRKITGDKKKDEEIRVRRKIRELRAQRRERQVPGNIFRVELDADHPLALGLPEQLYVFMEGTDSFAVSGNSSDVGAFTDDPAISGYITDESEKKVSKRVYLAEQSMGRGKVILYADDPNFRLFWRGLTRLFLNSVFLRTSY